MFLNNLKKINFVEIIILLFPILLISGPALPDLFAVGLSIYFLLFKIKEIKFSYKKDFWIYSFFLLNIWFIISSFFAYNINIAITDALIFIRFIFFTIAIYFLISLSKINFFKILFLFFFVVFCFTILDTLYQFYNYDSLIGFKGDMLGFKPEGLNARLSGPFRDLIPGAYLARFYFLIILLFLMVTPTLKKNKFNFFFLFILTLGLSVIYFTGERMAFATTIMGFSIAIVLIRKIRFYLLGILITSFLFIIININFHPAYKDYEILKSSAKHEGLLVEKKFKCPNDNTKICSKKINIQPKFIDVLINFRESAYGDIYSLSLKIWSDFPFTGIGLNNFNLICESEIKYKKLTDFGCTTHPHNLYIQALVESGLIGFIFFIIFVVTIFLKILSYKNFNLKILSIIIILTIFWPVMSTGSFLKNWNMVFICFLIGITLSICEANKIKNKD